MVERFHRTLNSMLSKVVAENQRDWDLHIDFVLAAYRGTKHESTGFTPNFLVFGRELRAPLDFLVGPPPADVDTWLSPEDFVADRQEMMANAYQLVRDKLKVVAERLKTHYDMKVKPALYSPGDWVYYYYPRRYEGKSHKWQAFFTGPFLVLKVLGPVNYMIQRSSRSTPQVVHVDKLKPFYGPTPRDWAAAIHTIREEKLALAAPDPGVALSTAGSPVQD
jgi:hypothetical protein